MKDQITETIEFPQGYDFELNGNVLIVKKNSNELKKAFNMKNIIGKKQGSNLILESKKGTKKELKMIKTIAAHSRNMIEGLGKKYVYKLEVAYLHFPVTLEMQKDKNQIIIKNFLGEKKPRIAKIIPGAEVIIERNFITVEAHDKEVAGQTAANLETATKIRNRDRRKFQDGIFITQKAGEAI
ncbi:MAG: 50S ribosomal protein L6 [Candidatus Pacearchaeota archaeon]|jgi:large subunit ribosomal protein L6